MDDKKIIIGLTGGIASGKSLAAELFREAGAYIIDADVISREVAESASVREALAAAFPRACRAGAVDRRLLREEVFGDDSKRKLLESIVHPLIEQEVVRRIRQAPNGVTVVVVPLLYEAGFDKYTDYDITVECPEAVRIKRLVKRDDITETLAGQMISAQATDAERARRADRVLYNSGSIAELRAQVLRALIAVREII